RCACRDRRALRTAEGGRQRTWNGDGRDVAVDQLARAGDTELVEEVAELRTQVAGDLRGMLVGERPELALERPDRLLPGLVEELLLGLARLALVIAVRA